MNPHERSPVSSPGRPASGPPARPPAAAVVAAPGGALASVSFGEFVWAKAEAGRRGGSGGRAARAAGAEGAEVGARRPGRGRSREAEAEPEPRPPGEPAGCSVLAWVVWGGCGGGGGGGVALACFGTGP